MNLDELRVLTAVGSRTDQTCSVGTFARADAASLKSVFSTSEVLQPRSDGVYPDCSSAAAPDVILHHVPTLYDRIRPWNVLVSAGTLRRAYPQALLISVVHEFSEAPRHWQLRIIALLRLSHAVIVHSDADLAALSRWHKRVVKIPLSACLFVPEFFTAASAEARASALRELRGKARADLPKNLGLEPGEKLLLHPGLLVPGKGVNFLGRLEPYLGAKTRFVVMGGLGPKERDREFARQTMENLRTELKGRLSFIESPDDEVFKRLLLAADLIVLPYDAGVSERRSSFFSAAACGGNVWATSGVYSGPLRLEHSGAHLVRAEDWAEGKTSALQSVAAALAEPEQKVLERRLRNLVWSDDRSWEKRAEKIQNFISTLRSPRHKKR